MIEPQTVFILGAGASKPYGFPLGMELRQQIVRALIHPEHKTFKLLRSCGYQSEQIKQFRDDLHDAIHDTIDDFLSDRPTHREIGSHAIAISLMDCEDHESLFKSLLAKRDWYPHLFRLLDFKKDSQLLAGIVTLNYDRSLEHYLFHTLSVSYEGNIKTTAKKRLAQFQILHLHGTLGEYPLRLYHREAQLDEIKKAAENLRIASDPDLDSSMLYKEARNLCEEASTIVFLGFGYHMQVIKRLGLLDPSPKRKFLGSSYGLTPRRCEELEELFQKRLSLDGHSYEIGTYFPDVLMQ
jgi:hypothetical protein